MITKYKIQLMGMTLLVGFLLPGCGFQPGKYFGWTEKPPTETLAMQLDAGNRLFTDGDYPAAAKIFDALQHSGRPVVVRQSLYGLACSRFMLAENRQEYHDAVQILEQWRLISPITFGPEDPRMLFAIFQEAMLRNKEGEPDASLSPEEQSLMRFFEYEQEIDALQGRIRSLKQQIKRFETQAASMKAMENSTKAMEEELNKLRDMIKTIETIDQEIQEKKQGISSP